MPLAKRLLLVALVLILASVVIVVLTPVLVADGIRLFAFWKARHQGVKIVLGQIEAPFLRPVVIHGIRVVSVQPCAFHIDFEAKNVQVALNLRALVSHTGARVIQQLSIDNLRGEVLRVSEPKLGACQFDWHLLHQLLADNFKLSNVDLRVENGSTQVDLHGVELNASVVESGRFTAHEIKIVAPWFFQKYADLRGATSWENDRLTLGALSLARGLDLESITADFSGLERKRIGFEVKFDAFGGKLRASISSENREEGANWDLAGTASDISLAQMSAALGLTHGAGGAVHASKFTFHGNPRNLARATASVWIEVTGFTWRERTAETIMLGAALYNRQIEVGQLYVKQRNNQFTLSGEYALPTKPSAWLNPDFRGDISASINDLGDFARLFGAGANSFAGSLNVAGTVNGRDRNIGGHVTVNGKSLLLFQTPVDALNAKLSLKGSQLRIDELEARHQNDFIRAHGEADLAHEHNYSATATGSIASLADYSPLLPVPWQAFHLDGTVAIDWKGHGTATAHFGDFRAQAQTVRLDSRFELLPFQAKIEGTYSPQNLFLREFQLANEHASFNAFVTVAENYLQLQTLRLDLNGKPKLQGNVFLPLARSRWLQGGALLESVDENQNFDVDLMLDPIDLGEFETALTGHASSSGNLTGKAETYGKLRSLQATIEAHLHDFAHKDPNRISGDLRAQSASGSLNLMLAVSPAGSGPVKMEARLPLQFDHAQRGDRSLFALDQPFSLRLDFPAIFLARLPHYLTNGIFHDGILSGQLVASASLRHPHILGEVQLANVKFAKTPGPVTGAAGRLVAHGSSASIEFARVDLENARLTFHGSIDFADTASLFVKLMPDVAVSEMAQFSQNDCISSANFFAIKPLSNQREALFPDVLEMDLRGGIAGDSWTLTLLENGREELLGPQMRLVRTFSLCKSGGESLQFGVAAQKTVVGSEAIEIFRGRRVRSSALNPSPELP
jgi:hypothetical protein